MAPNFRIYTHRNSDNLHVKLMGDFDGSSAWELLNVLKKNSWRVRKVFIHTSSLNNIYPFGRDIFCRNLSELKGYSVKLLFTGENAGQIAPAKSSCL